MPRMPGLRREKTRGAVSPSVILRNEGSRHNGAHVPGEAEILRLRAQNDTLFLAQHLE